MAEAARQGNASEPRPWAAYRRLCNTTVFYGALAVFVVAAALCTYSFVLSQTSSLPPIKKMSPWIEWKNRHHGDTPIPRILIWTGSLSETADASGVEMSAQNITCNFTDAHDDSRSSPLVPCFVTHDRSLLMESDAIVFHADLINASHLPRKRASNQLWVFWARTHPAVPAQATSRVERTGMPSSLSIPLSQLFNWTMAHREDAVVRIVHKSFVPGSPAAADMPSSIFNRSRRSAMEKRLDAAWIASTCELEKLKEELQSRRRDNDLVNDFGDVHDLDGMTQTVLQVLPDCGSSQCKSPTDCIAQIAKKFKFVVVASTPACFDSVDELVYEAFKHDIIPVVLASPNITPIFPPKSVISTTDKPGHLQELLLALLNDAEMYESYFDWKQKFRVVTLEHELCPLCQAIQEQPALQASPSLDYREWWERRIRCRAEPLFNVGTFRKDSLP